MVYQWYINGARHRDSGASIQWTAPSSAGNVMVEVRVSDGSHEPIIHTGTITIKPSPGVAWIGIWEVIKIEGESPSKIFGQGLDEVGLTLKIVENRMIFDTNGIFSWNFSIQGTGDLGDGQRLTFGIGMQLRGTYVVYDITYTMAFESVQVSLIPRSLWKDSGITEEDMEHDCHLSPEDGCNGCEPKL